MKAMVYGFQANNYFPDTDDCCVGDGGFATADTVRMDVTFSVRGGECIVRCFKVCKCNSKYECCFQVDTKKSCENKNFVIGIVNASMEYNVDEVRSAQQCYMLCDMKPSCYGMVFYTYVDPVTSTMSTYCVFAGAADCTNVNDCALSDSSTGFYSAMKCDSGWGSPI